MRESVLANEMAACQLGNTDYQPKAGQLFQIINNNSVSYY